MTPDVLGLTSGVPERSVARGDRLFAQQDGGRDIAVLVSGRLEVRQGDVVIAVLDRPGAFVGEIGALLRRPRSADVVALEDTTVRVIGDPEAFFEDHSALALELAVQLAGRLDRVNSYLVDLRRQYADRDDHLGMVDQVLGRLATRPPVDISPGSVRSPDY